MFKNNSRFAGLIDDKSDPMKKIGLKETNNNKDKNKDKDVVKQVVKDADKRVNNSFKGDDNKMNHFMDNGFRGRQNRNLSETEVQKLREEYKFKDDAKKKFEKQEEERRQQESLTIDNFPEFILHKNENNKIYEETETYIEKVKRIEEQENTNIDPDLEKVKNGWILMKKDKLTGKTIIQGEKSMKLEKEFKENIINNLIELHERRTQEYIDLNGYDTWEHMYKFKNWKEREESEDDTDFEDGSDEEFGTEYESDEECG
jgi:hypothetical protein